MLATLHELGPREFLLRMGAFEPKQLQHDRRHRHARCWHDAAVVTGSGGGGGGDVACVPGAYVIGAKKSGTSSLRAALLNLRTRVFAPRTLKEPTWWTSRRAFGYPRNSSHFDWYVELYRPVTDEWLRQSNGQGTRLLAVLTNR